MVFSVRIEPSGHSFTTNGQDSLLEAALKHNLHFPYGCRNGNCGACKAQLRQGQVKYLNPAPQEGLTTAEQQLGTILLCQAYPVSDIVVEVDEVSTEQIPIKVYPCRVARLQQLCHDVMGIWLELPSSQRMPFQAGQYIDILMKDGRKRSFSLANPPEQDRFLELHVRHYQGGKFSDYAFSGLHEKEFMRIQGPLGRFVLNKDSDAPMIFVAGGTGFAPIKGIIEHSLATGFTRSIYLYWGVRAKRDLYMENLVEDWLSHYSHIHYAPVLSEPLPEDAWTGRTGFVHEAVAADFADFASYEVYVSGPPVMCQAVRSSLTEKGLSPKRIYSDAFEFAAN